MTNDETGKVILVTGASSGIGALSARAPALAGHTVYAAIRRIATRNATAAADLTSYGTDHRVTEVAEAVARPVAVKHGTRPLRTHIDPSRDGSEVVSAVADRLRADFCRRIGLDSLLTAGSSL